MGKSDTAARRTGPERLLTLALIVLALAVRAQTAVGETPDGAALASIDVVMSVEPSRPTAGESFRLVLRIGAPPDTVAVDGPRLPRGLVMQAAETRDEASPSGDGRGTIIEYTIIASADGQYFIPPVSIRSGDLEARSEALSFTVGEEGAPPSVQWIFPDRAPYAFETFRVLLVGSGLPEGEISGPEAPDVPDGVFLERLSDARSESGIIAAYILTAVKSGRYELAGETVRVGTREFTTVPGAFRITTAPGEISASHAVGTYSAAIDVSRDAVGVSESTEIAVTLSGSGNLIFVTMPSMRLRRDGRAAGAEDAAVSYREKNSVSARMEGYFGSRTRVWTIAPRQPGHYEVSFEKLPVLSPDSGSISYLTVPAAFFVVSPADDGSGSAGGARSSTPPGTSQGAALSAPPTASKAAPQPTPQAKDLPLLSDYREVVRLQPPGRYKHPLWYVCIAIPVAAIAYILLKGNGKRRRGESGSASVFKTTGISIVALAAISCLGGSAGDDRSRIFADSCAAYVAGRYETAVDGYTRSLAVFPDNPILLYDRSLAYFREGEAGQSLRDAERLARFLVRPVSMPDEFERLRPALAGYYGIAPSAAKVAVYPDALFWSTSLCLGVLAGCVALFVRRRRAFLLILVVTAVLAACVSTALLAASAALLETPYALVSGGNGAAAYAVPDPSATPVFSIPFGTAVRIKDEIEGYVLTETPELRVGWVRRDDAFRF